MIDNRGRLLTFGSPQDGQLGGGTTGEFIEKAGKISYDLVLSPTVISTFYMKVREWGRWVGGWVGGVLLVRVAAKVMVFVGFWSRTFGRREGERRPTKSRV